MKGESVFRRDPSGAVNLHRPAYAQVGLGLLKLALLGSLADRGLGPCPQRARLDVVDVSVHTQLAVQIRQPGEMVGVRVGDDDEVQPGDAEVPKLPVQPGRPGSAVDQDRLAPRCTDQCRASLTDVQDAHFSAGGPVAGPSERRDLPRCPAEDRLDSHSGPGQEGRDEKSEQQAVAWRRRRERARLLQPGA